jgi:hypothetical protein
MSKIEDFKIHGIELSKEDFKLIESQFRNKFFVSGEKLNWKGEKRPGWTEFLEDKLVVDFDGEINQQLLKSDSFYVYFEFGRNIYICSFEQIVDYFDNKPEWLEQDVYIFPKEMHWCMVNTHDSNLILVT